MRRMTLLLFQLLLAVFAAYAVIYDVPNEYLFVPLLCLIAMLVLQRHPQHSPHSNQGKTLSDA